MQQEVKRRRRRVFVFLALAILLSSCRGKPDVVQPPAVVPMRVVTDDLGRTVDVPVKITRVVSLAPSLTENIFAVGAGDRLVGVTTFCNYPEAANSIAKIGDTMNPNMESIVALKPDVVFVSTASQIEAFMNTLEANGIAVYVTNPTNLMEIINGLRKLSTVFGTEEQAGPLVDSLYKRYQAVTSGALDTLLQIDEEEEEYLKRTLPTTVFVQISKEPLFTIGKTSFLNDILHKAGGKSVTSDVETAYPKLSKETASALNPEAIILSDSEDNKEPNEVFKNSRAVISGRVYKVNADLLSRPGPRLVDALERIAHDLHSEKFK